MLNLDEILASTGGQLISGSGGNRRFRGVSTDSRTLRKNEIFVALKGPRFDGHDYIAQTVKSGAGALIVSKVPKRAGSIPVIRVKNTLAALGDMAAFYRRKFSLPVIAVTGSAGKTTTKEMVARVLSSKYHVLKSRRSENNLIGVPLTLFRLRQSHQIAVLEFGTNQKGEIRRLTQIAAPDVAILTNIGEAHLQGLKSLAGVAVEKTDLVRYMPRGGTVIYNRDNERLRVVTSMPGPKKRISFGVTFRCRNKATHIKVTKKGKTEFRVRNRRYCINTAMNGFLYNALAAICCGELFRIRYNDIARALATFRSGSGRFSLKRSNGIIFINDSYNANPVSFRAAVETLARLPSRGDKHLACGDMLELGHRSRRHHEQLADQIAATNITWIYGFGSQMEHLVRWLRRTSPEKHVRHYRDFDTLIKDCKASLKKNDMILIKGSRGLRMERLWERVSRR